MNSLNERKKIQKLLRREQFVSDLPVHFYHSRCGAPLQFSLSVNPIAPKFTMHGWIWDKFRDIQNPYLFSIVLASLINVLLRIQVPNILTTKTRRKINNVFIRAKY